MYIIHQNIKKHFHPYFKTRKQNGTMILTPSVVFLYLYAYGSTFKGTLSLQTEANTMLV